MTTHALIEVGLSRRCRVAARRLASGETTWEAEMAAQTERFETVIVGGGQAGLSTGYHLAKQGRRFVILDGGARVGDPWRQRWDSLRLYSPAAYDGLPGLPFPARGNAYPTAHEMADYLETYARQFDLPVLSDTTVEALSRDGARYVLTAGERTFEADNVVVATGVKIGRAHV